MSFMVFSASSCGGDSSRNAGNAEGKARLDSLFTSIENSGRWMGSFSLYEDDVEVYSRAFGYADVNLKIANSVETKFRLGSISSLYTATIIMKLAEDGKIDLNQSINSFFPEVSKSPKITIKDLLKHRSGIFNLMLDLNYWTYYRTSISEKELYKKIVANGLVCEPGTKSQYSSSNYVLLAMLSEMVSGRPYDVLLDSIVCRPLGLKNTLVGGSISSADGEALSYLGKAPKWFEASETDLSSCIGESSVISTATEVNKFVSALLSGRIVSEASVSAMQEFDEGYGIGFVQSPRKDDAIGQVGNLDGFSTEVTTFVHDGKRLTMTYLSNASSEPMDILDYAMSAYLYKSNEKVLSKFSRIVVLTEQELGEIVGTFSNDKYATTFSLMVNKDSGELELGINNETDRYAIETFENGEFCVELPEEETPIHFNISADKNSLMLSNGMVLNRKSAE